MYTSAKVKPQAVAKSWLTGQLLHLLPLFLDWQQLANESLKIVVYIGRDGVNQADDRRDRGMICASRFVMCV
eukprot:1151946-Pelagomonas_calceolata.AAC.1